MFGRPCPEDGGRLFRLILISLPTQLVRSRWLQRLPCLCRACRAPGSWTVSPEVPHYWGSVRPDCQFCGKRQTVPLGELCAASFGLWPHELSRGGRSPVSCLRYTSSGSGGVALGAWFLLMAPKASRTPRISRGKANLVPIGRRKEKKQAAPLPGDQTNA
ncbi:hypothetical protein NDU88_001042 [Pleurodeles waltl]|uniref:Uncharacterized protein n=1 Tax=Pleurodeles waltl TaxID=8319 RepID=A0AAV7TH81_PLEWA|nr:hypothetical protein NDU88_001042 [Pleurodeles waltl]